MKEPALRPVEPGHVAACWRAEEVRDMPPGMYLSKEAVEHPLD
jgi:hypothetical protein